ncbi:MAG: HAD family hydrolase [Candidatus Rokubacteria bacterium]|nr:HAD family hydrolase [Candidatus Rokubacteria bacterium]MBI3826575.1 HAD family hydrolase [Candidatus Rokubacteria bacterium]
MSPRYRAVLFDLFDTLVRFDRRRLPEIEINGRTVHSTARLLHEVLAPHAPGVDLAAFHGAMISSWQDAERRRAVDHREVPAQERFARVLECLAVDPARCDPGLVEALLETHRRELAKAAEFPAHYGALLERLAGRYRLAVVSNFDYTPTALGILESAGVIGLFDTIVISDAFGWRKPAPSIFLEALGRLDVAPRESLFVGDRADIDVGGAHGVGMDAAWINPDREALPAGLAPPEFEIRDLGELGPILEP